MAFVEGRSLADKVAQGPLPAQEAAWLVRRIAEAMGDAHQKGVIHRDLKPANVLLDKSDEPKVTDFGLAKRVQGDSHLTANGQILGAPRYMPPEQAAGKLNQVAEPADIYAMGAILYTLLTGRPPFQAAPFSTRAVAPFSMLITSQACRRKRLRPKRRFRPSGPCRGRRLG
jgi:eukaryotic-like serine/threonine-protein kinase